MLRRVLLAQLGLGISFGAWVIISGCQATGSTLGGSGIPVAQGGVSSSNGGNTATPDTNGGNNFLMGGQGGQFSSGRGGSGTSSGQGGSSTNPGQGGSNQTGGTSSSSSTGGSNQTGGTSSSATGGSTSSNKGGSSQTGGTTSSSTSPATGGTTSASTATGIGGASTTSSASGTNPTATAASCASDFMPLLGGSSYNWLSFDSTKSCGMQGSVYGYGDGTSCTIPAAGICSGGKCCISGKTAGGTTGATDYSNYGCGIGFDLNATAGTTSVKNAYTATQGPAKGFKLALSGTVAAGQKIRIKYAPAATNPTGGTSPYKEVTTVAAASGTILFSDAACPTWATAAQCSLPTSGVYSLQIELVGGGAETAVGAFTDFCLTSLTPAL
jgi:hypothetical protein